MSGETEGNSVADERDHCCAKNSGIARGEKKNKFSSLTKCHRDQA